MRRILAAGALLLVVLAVPTPTFAAAATTVLRLPAPTGAAPIGTVAVHLIDRSRRDPWVPGEPVRELMIQIWYPARAVHGYPVAPWVTPALVPVVNPTGADVTLPSTHAHLGAPAAPGRHPVVLYSPGFGVERTGSTALVEDLASHGYVVVTVDHTHDSPLVEFPDGRTAARAVPEATDPADEDRIVAKALAVRVTDTRFVLDQLTTISRGGNPDAEHRPLPRGLGGALDLHAVGMIGHSLGGATAAETMFEDRRVVAGVNLDGTMSGAVLDGGLDRPLLLFSSDTHDPTGSGASDDETWTRMWAGLRGPRHWLQLLGSGHMSFTDYEVLLAQAGVPADALQPAFGTIDGERAVRLERAYLLAFADRYLRGRRAGLLDGPSACNPEMRFIG